MTKRATVGKTVFPAKFANVSREEVWEKYIAPGGNGFCRIANGDKVASQINLLTRSKSSMPDSACMAVMRVFGWYTKWYGETLCGLKNPNDEFDLLVIEDEGSIVSGVIKIAFRDSIRAQANILLTRSFQKPTLKKGVHYQHCVVRPSIGPNFGKGNKPLLVIDPTLATGGSVITCLNWLRDTHQIKIKRNRIIVWTLVAAPFGVDRLCKKGIRIVTAELAQGLDDRGYIVDKSGQQWIGNMAEFFSNCILR